MVELFKEFIPESQEVQDEATVYILRDMMKSVVNAGTGRAFTLEI